MITRRDFLATGTAALASATTARSYAQILGANDRVNFAIIGLNSRAYAHLSALKANRKDAKITHVCDVESNILQKFAGAVQKEVDEKPATDKDFRKVLASKDVDAITIATPDHWHAPMAIAGVEAGKHVYVEKPCSHNPAEGDMLVEAQKKYSKLVQMGNQQRSSPHTIKIIGEIHDGLIGRAYCGQRLVRQHPQVHRLRQARTRPRHARLGPLAGSRPAPALQRQRPALQLALVPHLGHRRNAQQRHPRGRRLPLGSRRRHAATRHRRRRPLRLQGRLAVLRHPHHQLRIRRQPSSTGTASAATAHAPTTAIAAPSSSAPPAPSSSIATATRSTTSTAKRPTSSGPGKKPPRPISPAATP